MKILRTKKPTAPKGVLFSVRDGIRRDEHLHAEMQPAGAFASDEAAIRILVRNGMSRADARRLLGISRGYGG